MEKETMTARYIDAAEVERLAAEFEGEAARCHYNGNTIEATIPSAHKAWEGAEYQAKAAAKKLRSLLAAAKPMPATCLAAVPDDRMFPMQYGPAIPWSVAEQIYAGYVALFGKNQSLERIAERGGFGWHEVDCMWRKPKGRSAMLAAAPPPPAEKV